MRKPLITALMLAALVLVPPAIWAGKGKPPNASKNKTGGEKKVVATNAQKSVAQLRRELAQRNTIGANNSGSAVNNNNNNSNNNNNNNSNNNSIRNNNSAGSQYGQPTRPQQLNQVKQIPGRPLSQYAKGPIKKPVGNNNSAGGQYGQPIRLQQLNQFKQIPGRPLSQYAKGPIKRPVSNNNSAGGQYGQPTRPQQLGQVQPIPGRSLNQYDKVTFPSANNNNNNVRNINKGRVGNVNNNSHYESTSAPLKSTGPVLKRAKAQKFKKIFIPQYFTKGPGGKYVPSTLSFRQHYEDHPFYSIKPDPTKPGHYVVRKLNKEELPPGTKERVAKE